MKYTKYLVKGVYINVAALKTDWFLLKIPVILLSIIIVAMSIITIIGMLPMTLLADEYRNIKCRLIHFKRNEYKL